MYGKLYYYHKYEFLSCNNNSHETVVNNSRMLVSCWTTIHFNNFRHYLLEMVYVLLALGNIDSLPKFKDSVNKLLFGSGFGDTPYVFFELMPQSSVIVLQG